MTTGIVPLENVLARLHDSNALTSTEKIKAKYLVVGNITDYRDYFASMVTRLDFLAAGILATSAVAPQMDAVRTAITTAVRAETSTAAAQKAAAAELDHHPPNIGFEIESRITKEKEARIRELIKSTLREQNFANGAHGVDLYRQILDQVHGNMEHLRESSRKFSAAHDSHPEADPPVYELFFGAPSARYDAGASLARNLPDEMRLLLRVRSNPTLFEKILTDMRALSAQEEIDQIKAAQARARSWYELEAASMSLLAMSPLEQAITAALEPYFEPRKRNLKMVLRSALG